MDILDAIFTRRSIRKYTGELITDSQLETILKAGFCAPSAHNKQPWHFLVIKDKEKIDKISNLHPYAKMAPSAGCVIIACGDKDIEDQTGFLVEDCSAAMQNILLAAHGIELGAVWCALHPIENITEKINEFFSIPENIIPVGMIVVGNKEKDRKPNDRYIKERIHFDQW